MSQATIDNLLTEAQSPQIDGIIVIDQRGNIVGFDPDAEQLLGYSSHELNGKPITCLMPESYRAEHPKHLQSALHRPGKVSKLHLKRTIVACHKNGEMIPLAITVSADSSGQNVRFTGILQDLRKHEQQVNQLHQNIQQTTSALQRRIEFDDLLNKYANLLLSCSAEELKLQINSALQDMALFLQVDHVYLLSFNEQLAEATLWTSWRRSSLVNPFPDQFTVPEHIPLVELLHAKQELVVDESDHSQEDLFQLMQALSPNGFRSSWLTPVFNPQGDISGCVGFTFLDDSHKPNAFTQPLLSLALRLLASALARHQLIDRMLENERQISRKGRLLADKAAFSQQLQKYTDNLYQASAGSLGKIIDNTLLESALMSGHQNAWCWLNQAHSNAGRVLSNPKPQRYLPEELNVLRDWFVEYKPINLCSIQEDKSCLTEDKEILGDTLENISSSLSKLGIHNIVLVPIKRATTSIGFLVYYNSAPQYPINQEVLDFLQAYGQIFANTLQHHETQLQLNNTRRALEDANRVLSRQALHDPLTGLANRRAFDDTIRTEFDRAKRHHSSLCLILGDIDFFKRYNDHFGHPQGDVCLQQVAKVMQDTFHRAGEVCCRYGGEEFAIILPAINRAEAQRQGERLLNNLQAAQIAHAPDSSLPFISMSLGLALIMPEDSTDLVEDLIKNADKALYQAKHSGRNRLAWIREQG